MYIKAVTFFTILFIKIYFSFLNIIPYSKQVLYTFEIILSDFLTDDFL